MNAHFTRTKTAAAVSALLAAMAMPPANAVEVANNGLGDAAISPFYTVRANQVTSISVVNTSADYVAAFHIRFKRATDSADVRDFNVFLSPNDVWNATLSLNPDGTVAIKTVDVSCTAPTLMPRGTVNNAANRQLGFVSIGNNAAGQAVREMDLDSRFGDTVRDGYIEIIELGVALPLSPVNDQASLLASWAVKTTVPPTVVNGTTLGLDCAKLASVYPPTQRAIQVTGSQSNPVNWGTSRVACNLDTSLSVGQTASGVNAFRAEFCEPLNVLKVASNIVRVNTGMIFDAPATNLANFASPGTLARGTPAQVLPLYPVTPVPVGTENYAQPNADDLMAWTPNGFGGQQNPGTPVVGGPFPNLMNGRPGGFFVRGGSTNTAGSLIQDPQAALSRQVFNGYPVAATFNSGVGGSSIATVLAVDSLITATAVVNEWQSVIANTTPQTGWVVTFPTKNYRDWGCALVGVTYWDREEREVVGLVQPSPGSTNGLCAEVNTLSFRMNKNFFGGINLDPVHPTVYSITGEEPVQQGFTSGWARLSFEESAGLISSNGIAFWGWPVTGFAATSVTNGAVSSYNTAHAYERDITGVVPPTP